ncbi:hypothetical protein FF098_017160 [Parvularcula flava]|uniref:Uncharacterized protein n=1 Tax=Aquisalinus luteolus TaxID=1566827 RepID=A0A8J3A4L6_9PROT|nr:hypothetical protein [Aquisalinus luteolus]NHK29638.1 hypothetical protein [Aquisalinus luteolus]GGI02252.1 hypothetical protein GCM10011355_34820 [Aquisalinus luteolus]
MTDHEIKPALLRRPVTWRVDNACLHRQDRAREPITLPFDRITSLRMTRTVFRGQRLERFELTGPWGSEIISVNTTDVVAASNEQLAAFHRLLIDTLPRISEVRPDLAVILAERKGPKWALFSIGVIAVVAASLMLVIAMLTAQDRLWAAAVPLGTLFLFGLMISLNVRPWQDPPSVTPDDLAAELRQGLEKKAEASKTKT